MKDAAVDSKHHEQTLSAQRSFPEKVEAPVSYTHLTLPTIYSV